MSGRRVRVGPASDVAAGAVRTVGLAPDPDRSFPRRAVVVRDRHGQLRAYLDLCKHLPVPLDGGTGQFLASDRVHLICGTHGALYRPEDGLCVRGPCEGASLDPLDLIEEGGVLYVVDSAG
jgi:nitrite reductase/ring-hydroxylating ferredoxin subunit